VTKAWTEAGCPEEKLLIGLSSYGYSYYLGYTAQHSPGSPIASWAEAGEFTGEPGILSYFEVSVRPEYCDGLNGIELPVNTGEVILCLGIDVAIATIVVLDPVVPIVNSK